MVSCVRIEFKLRVHLLKGLSTMRKYSLGALRILLIVVAGVGYYIYNQFKGDPTELSTRAGELTFLSDRDGDWDVYLLDQEDNLHNLTESSSGHEYFFNYTFEGDKVRLFSTGSGAFTPADVMADGSEFRTLSFIEAAVDIVQSGQLDMDPAWSPDGQKLLWSSMRDFNAELYLSNTDGSE